MRYRTSGIDGVVNIYKEKGYTSHDVVAVVRKITGCKTGHTGTLDPDAEGVLPVCLGKATRISDYIASETKEYEAVVSFGTATDTQDASGAVVAEKAMAIGEDALRDVIASFIGDYEQIPPMYSALKVNGQKLYDLARAGVEVERKARKIHIHNIEVLEMDYPRSARIHVVCSKGTYIRTLCTDIGEKADSAAHMASLVRTRTGAFLLRKSIVLDTLREMAEAGRLLEAVLPMREALAGFRTAVADGAAVGKLLYNGNAVPLQHVRLPDAVAEGERLAVTDENDTLVGIYTVSAAEGCMRPAVVLL